MLQPVEPLAVCPHDRTLVYQREDGFLTCLCLPDEEGPHTRSDLRLRDARRAPEGDKLAPEEIAARDADRRLGERASAESR